MSSISDARAHHSAQEQLSTGPASARNLAASELPAVRWLRQQVIESDSDATAANFPAPSLVSANLGCTSGVLRDYVLWWITHPDRGSDFAVRTRWTRWLPAPMLLRAMMWLGYDGFLYLRGDHVLGHVYFQRRGSSMYAFSAAVDPELRGKGYAVMMIMDCLAYASQLPGITQARVGRGNSEYNSRLLARIRTHEARLGWKVDADGWVAFRPEGLVTKLQSPPYERKAA